ncbi:MAG: chorismate-binding protein, partial [Thiogranum sp.]
MTRDQFQNLASQGYNRIPVAREVLADLDTPLSTYLKLASGPYSYLFESVQGGEKWGRYSIIGLPCRQVVRIYGERIEVWADGQCSETLNSGDPLQWIEDFQGRLRVAEIDGMPRFAGGLVGYFGYDAVRYMESKLKGVDKPDPLQTPDILLMVSDDVVVFDNLTGKLQMIVHVDAGKADAWDSAQARLDQLMAQLRRPVDIPGALGGARKVSEKDFVSGFTEEGFKAAVERVKQYIVEGDVMQVVLSQRLSIPFQAPPLDLYRALRSLNPSPYMFYLDLNDFYVVGSSPEILVRLEDRVITVRPIAGTRPRGRDEAEDLALEEDLLSDPKELAEHLMLIDL